MDGVRFARESREFVNTSESPPSAETVVRKLANASSTDLVFASGRSLRLSRFLASLVEPGDEVQFSLPFGANGFSSSELLVKSSSGRCLYQTLIGYAAKPRLDRQTHPYVQAEIPDGRLGFASLHMPCAAVRDYFYHPKRNENTGDATLYDVLRAQPDASLADLRLAYRLRHLELVAIGAPKIAHLALTRAMNILALPELRACHDALLADPKTPALFPFGGFGLILAAGIPSEGCFFVRRILSFIPTVKGRHLTIPLRKLNYLSDRAIYRDSRLKLEVTFDPAVLPIGFQPDWNRWKHLVTANVSLQALFVRTGKYIHRSNEWKLLTWETALAGSLEVSVSEDLKSNLLLAQKTHQLFGKYSDWIDRVRARLEQTPLEKTEVERLAIEEDVSADFDVAQINWRPDYDSFYYQHLLVRAERLYLFRDQYLFLLPSVLVAETPQAGHATYLFSRPDSLADFFRLYRATTREEILKNRNNTADRLGFLGRMVHGIDKRDWVERLKDWLGEKPLQSRWTE